MPDSPGIDPALLADPRMRAAPAERDVAGVYRLLTRQGISQREIAAATGQSQSEISEILKGRQVQAYDLLVRICEGLGIPRGAMGLSFGAYPVDSPDSAPGGEDQDDDVLRRQFQNLLALAGVAAFGTAIPGVGQLGAEAVPGDLVGGLRA